eukprot:g8546.t1
MGASSSTSSSKSPAWYPGEPSDAVSGHDEYYCCGNAPSSQPPVLKEGSDGAQSSIAAEGKQEAGGVAPTSATTPLPSPSSSPMAASIPGNSSNAKRDAIDPQAESKKAGRDIKALPVVELSGMKFIAQGAFCAVFACKYRGLSVVAKRVREDLPLPARRAALANLWEEFECLRPLSHPNIIEAYGLCRVRCREGYDDWNEKDVCLLLEELALGTVGHLFGTIHTVEKNLASAMARSRKMRMFPFRCRLDRILELALALRYVHGGSGRGVMMHRDIKSVNVGFAQNGRLKLLDFGLSKITPPGTTEDDTYKMTGEVGSYRYMAPELVKHNPYNAKVDIYSWAILSWEILAIDRPYSWATETTFVTRVVNGGERPELQKSWPDRLCKLLESAWHSDHAKRPTAAQLVAELVAIKATLPAKYRRQRPIVTAPNPGGVGEGGARSSSNRRHSWTPQTASSMLDTDGRTRPFVANGAFCSVFLCKYQGHNVVAKRVREDLPLTTRREALNNLWSEYECLRPLSHPNVVDVYGLCRVKRRQDYDDWDEKDVCLLVEELALGTVGHLFGTIYTVEKNLASAIAKSRLMKLMPFRSRLDRALELALALEYVHGGSQMGIMIHRDIKSVNVGFAKNGNLKLIDFGLAKMLPDDATESEDTYQMTGEVGSYRYMAPEIVRHQPYNAKADIYSWAILTWEMISINKPFAGVTESTFIKRVVMGGERPALDKNWSNGLSKLLASAWHADYEKRPTAAQVVVALREIKAQLPAPRGSFNKRPSATINVSRRHSWAGGASMSSKPRVTAVIQHPDSTVNTEVVVSGGDRDGANARLSTATAEASEMTAAAEMGALDAEAIEHALLDALSTGEGAEIADTWDFAEKLGCPHTDTVGVLISLEAEEMLKSKLLQTTYFVVSPEGQRVIQEGSPEIRVLECVPQGDAGISKADLEAALGADLVKIGLGPCMKNKWLAKGGGGALVRGANGGDGGSVADTVKELLQKLEAGEALADQQAKDLKKRKLVAQVVRKSFKVTRGTSYAVRRVKRQAELTKEMLASGSWKDATFKAYNFKTLGAPCGGGNLHPLLKVRSEFRKILMYMGFEEMPTNRWVESSFWNFDSLFQPQSHPARDAHDTFFIKDPASALSFPEEYLEVVKDTHETGGSTGSVGYGCQWKREEASKNLLRTHTTAVSSQMLYRIANQEGGFTPKRYFSIDRVFRNETMDATHLCEFHQVEGMVADRNLCLGDLIGVIRTFFHKIGITQIRFKPAFNPYTEPSMEIFGYHPDLKKWTEIGNSGMFRPEMLLPMGLPKDVRVIAWGLSLERPTMIKYGITNIRELFGHKADLNRTKTAPVCRFD